jgi:hypothetical protein
VGYNNPAQLTHSAPFTAWARDLRLFTESDIMLHKFGSYSFPTAWDYSIHMSHDYIYLIYIVGHKVYDNNCW